MKTTYNQTFLEEVSNLVDEAPMNPTEIQRDGAASAWLLSDDLFNSLMAKARAYDEMTGSAQDDQDEAEMLAALDEAVKASTNKTSQD